MGVWLPSPFKAVITSTLYLITQGIRYIFFSLGFHLYFYPVVAVLPASLASTARFLRGHGNQ